MRLRFLLLLLIATIFGAAYWYSMMVGCRLPLAYRVGDIDSSFEIQEQEVLSIARSAEQMWESATGRDLFVYDDEADLTINFVYDNRQQYADAEEALRTELDDRKGLSDTVRSQYEELLDAYGTLENAYEQKSDAYEQELRKYNNEVAAWNEKGGAPEDVFAELANRQNSLADTQNSLNKIAQQLNALAQEMNALSARGNNVISDYNQIVDTYNDRFTEEHEFTQGDYQNSTINVYQFDTHEELEIVLAHEFGHALFLDHVEGEDSIMYHFMEAQSLETGVTAEDVAALEARCGEGKSSLWSLFRFLIN